MKVSCFCWRIWYFLCIFWCGKKEGAEGGVKKIPLTNIVPSIRITFKLKTPLTMLVAEAGLGCEEE